MKFPGSLIRIDSIGFLQVSDEDKRKYEQLKEDNKKRAPADQKYEESNRGLLFTCYQSSLTNGFVRQSIDFANNDFWPATSILPTNHGTPPLSHSQCSLQNTFTHFILFYFYILFSYEFEFLHQVKTPSSAARPTSCRRHLSSRNSRRTARSSSR